MHQLPDSRPRLDVSTGLIPSISTSATECVLGERGRVEMLPPLDELAPDDALVLLTALARDGGMARKFPAREAGSTTCRHRRGGGAAGDGSGIALWRSTVKRWSDRPREIARMTGDVHPVLLGNEPPVFNSGGVWRPHRLSGLPGSCRPKECLRFHRGAPNPLGRKRRTRASFWTFMQGMTTAGAGATSGIVTPKHL